MAVNVVSTPDVNVNANSNTKSYWLSPYRPIEFELQRIDFTFTSITFRDVNSAYIDKTGIGAEFAAFTAPFQIYLTSTSFPNGEYTVTNISTNSLSFTHNLGLASGTYPYTGGNLFVVRENYFLKVKVKVAGVEVGITRVRQGLYSETMWVDVSAFIRSSLSTAESYNFTTLNVGDTNLSNYFQIDVSENWNDNEGSYETFSAKWYFSYGINQLRSTYDGNLGEFVPFTNYTGDETRAMFLSDFETPTYFNGYPFSLDFIFNESLDTTTYDILKKEEKFDINDGTIGTTSSILAKTSSEKGKINRMKLLESYTSSVDYIDVWLEKVNLS